LFLGAAKIVEKKLGEGGWRKKGGLSLPCEIKKAGE
jgi:hypothetical protein